MTFQIIVNGQSFLQFESAMLMRSIDSHSGEYTITGSSTFGVPYPVRAGDFAQILINGVPKCTGYVDEVAVDMDATAHTITFGGRDTIQDLIDSSMPDSVKVKKGPISLQKLCQNAIAALGANVEVIDRVGNLTAITAQQTSTAFSFLPEEELDSESGQTCMEYLSSFARKKQVYLVSDGAGRLVIFRPSGEIASTPIQHAPGLINNNVVSFTSRVSQQMRFNTYLCRTQGDIAFDINNLNTLEATDITGVATDSQIRDSRRYEFLSEETLTQPECVSRAAEESNIARAHSTEYTCTVRGFEQQDGTLWDFGQIVNLRDDFANMRGQFLIRDVAYNFSIDGSTTTLTLVPPDAYQVIAELSDTDRRRSTEAPAFERQQPDNIRRVAR
jgi:prophage tail gpP-like protein